MTCQNCGRVIGRLEKPFLFNDAVVCGECNTRLRTARSGERGRQKLHQLIGGTLVVVGFFGWFLGLYLKRRHFEDTLRDDFGAAGLAVFGVATIAFFVGVVWYLWARLTAWWTGGT
jgi:hypothetical protein